MKEARTSFVAACGQPTRDRFVALQGSATVTGVAFFDLLPASAEWLVRVGPRLAVISAGENNPFGQPHADVLERLRSAGVRVLRTDRDGAVTALSDGQTLRIHSFVESRQ